MPIHPNTRAKRKFLMAIMNPRINQPIPISVSYTITKCRERQSHAGVSDCVVINGESPFGAYGEELLRVTRDALLFAP